MKVKIKATGEIINVMRRFNPEAQHMNDFVFKEISGTSSCRTFRTHELEFIEPDDNLYNTISSRYNTQMSEREKEIDWKQRRYEIAKEVLPQIIHRVKPGPSAAAIKFSCVDAAKAAVDYADALIKELKK